MTEAIVYTDGGCSGNPGPGAWAFTLSAQGERQEGSGAEAQTTNNRMELTAVIRALARCRELGLGRAVVHTDSQYVKNGITQWILAWKRNGWRTSSKSPVKNRELWEELDSLCAGLILEWRWVKGHAGVIENERCDSLVRQRMDELR